MFAAGTDPLRVLLPARSVAGLTPEKTTATPWHSTALDPFKKATARLRSRAHVSAPASLTSSLGITIFQLREPLFGQTRSGLAAALTATQPQARRLLDKADDVQRQQDEMQNEDWIIGACGAVRDEEEVGDHGRHSHWFYSPLGKCTQGCARCREPQTINDIVLR